MTEPEKIDVTPEDREAAADIWRYYIAKVGEVMTEKAMREGVMDYGLPTCVARHRIASVRAVEAERDLWRKRAEGLEAALTPFVEGAAHTQVFLRTREKMHPAGQDLYAEDVDRARAALAKEEPGHEQPADRAGILTSLESPTNELVGLVIENLPSHAEMDREDRDSIKRLLAAVGEFFARSADLRAQQPLPADQVDMAAANVAETVMKHPDFEKRLGHLTLPDCRTIGEAVITAIAPALKAQGAAEERARIVAWLRYDAARTEQEAIKIVANTAGNPRTNAAEWNMLVGLKRGLADAIEAQEPQP